jgi:REP element-mobilizing transposase RayT
MTRHARNESQTGIYHIITRGINQQNVFEYAEDYMRFKEILLSLKKKSGIVLYGYCLMGNHVHLAIRAGTEPIGNSFKRIGVSYAAWYNGKYKRSGPLFQDRFRSEPIDDDVYFLAVLRYIHRNPVKAGICRNPGDYNWSSYSDYIGKGDGLTDIPEVLQMYSKNPESQVKLFIEFTKEENEDTFLDIDNPARPSDEMLRDRVMKICGAKSVGDFQLLPEDEREFALISMRKGGMSIRQIVRMTGVPFGVVRKFSRG